MTRTPSLPFALLVLLGFSVSVSAAPGGLERSYQLGVDARALGLGSASVALPDDLGSALSRNPALLDTLARGTASAFHAPLFEGTRYEAVALAWPTLDSGAVGGSFIDVRTPDIENRDTQNFLVRTFAYSERRASLAWAHGLGLRGLSGGLSGRWFQQNLDAWTGESFGFDLGLCYRPPGTDWAFGFATEELYDSGVKLVSEREKAPRGVHLGASWGHEAPIGRFTAALEGGYVQGDDFRPALGVEYLWRKTAALRAGFDGRQASAGAGVAVGAWSVQYALGMQEPVGLTHRISAAFRFGKDLAAERLDRKTREERLKAEILEKMKSQSIQSYFASGEKALSEKRWDDARTEFSKVLAWDPTNAQASERIRQSEDLAKGDELRTDLEEARKFSEEGNDLDAMVRYKGALSLDPTNREAAAGLEKSGKRMREASRKAFSASSALSPAKAQQYFEEGLDLYLSGQYAKAMERWKVIVAANPIQRQVFDYVSRAQVKLEADKARSDLKRDEAVRTDRRQLLRQKAFEAYRKGDLKGAIEDWEQILKDDPKNAEALSESDKARKELQESRKRGVRW